MKVSFQLDGFDYQSDLSGGVPISIPLDFQGNQPNHFGAPRASNTTYEAGGFVGDTRRGGSCNVNTMTVVTHCNGTHTETVGHIVNQDVFVGHTATDILTSASLVTVKPDLWGDVSERSNETYRPPLLSADLVITAESLRTSFRATERSELLATDSLVIRTISSISKKSVSYSEKNPPPFMTVEAMQWVVENEFRHLLVDFPSVDRMYDDGLLTNHHLYWNVPEGTHELTGESRQDKTISEMVLIPEDVEDGLYLLNIQVPAMCSDAAPSRPVLFSVSKN